MKGAASRGEKCDVIIESPGTRLKRALPRKRPPRRNWRATARWLSKEYTAKGCGSGSAKEANDWAEESRGAARTPENPRGRSMSGAAVQSQSEGAARADKEREAPTRRPTFGICRDCNAAGAIYVADGTCGRQASPRAEGALNLATVLEW